MQNNMYTCKIFVINTLFQSYSYSNILLCKTQIDYKLSHFGWNKTAIHKNITVNKRAKKVLIYRNFFRNGFSTHVTRLERVRALGARPVSAEEHHVPLPLHAYAARVALLDLRYFTFEVPHAFRTGLPALRRYYPAVLRDALLHGETALQTLLHARGAILARGLVVARLQTDVLLGEVGADETLDRFARHYVVLVMMGFVTGGVVLGCAARVAPAFPAAFHLFVYHVSRARIFRDVVVFCAVRVAHT